VPVEVFAIGLKRRPKQVGGADGIPNLPAYGNKGVVWRTLAFQVLKGKGGNPSAPLMPLRNSSWTKSYPSHIRNLRFRTAPEFLLRYTDDADSRTIRPSGPDHDTTVLLFIRSITIIVTCPSLYVPLG